MLMSAQDSCCFSTEHDVSRNQRQEHHRKASHFREMSLWLNLPMTQMTIVAKCDVNVKD